MFRLMRPKTSEPPWPSLFRGANVYVDGVGTCVVESHVDGTTYRVSDSKGNSHDIMPTPIFVWNKVQTVNGGGNERATSGDDG